MKPIVLYRHDRIDSDQKTEIQAIKKYFDLTHFRTPCCMAKSLIIGRYSVLPCYSDLEDELLFYESRLINTRAAHDWIANFDYYYDLADYTFPSWNSIAETRYEGPFVLKGRTNSRKYQWDTHMYAQTRADAIRIAGELNNDSLIGKQGIIYRKYIPLKTYEIGINGMRFCNEHRFFFYKETMLSHGYYWSLADNPDLGFCSQKMIDFAAEVAKISAENVDFFVLDIAEKEDGEMILVEVNDAQMSGLSMNNPEELWSNMHACLQNEV